MKKRTAQILILSSTLTAVSAWAGPPDPWVTAKTKVALWTKVSGEAKSYSAYAHAVSLVNQTPKIHRIASEVDAPTQFSEQERTGLDR